MVASFTRMSQWAGWLIAISTINQAAGQETVYEKLVEDPNFSLFRDVLRFAGFNAGSVLADISQSLTLFVPTNDAILQDPAVAVYLDQPGWGVHLKELCELHLVMSETLSISDIFEGESSFLNTSLGFLELSTENQTIGGVPIVQGASITAANGVIHVIDGIFRNEWRGVSLSDKTPALVSSNLNDVIVGTGFGKELDGFMPYGTTFIATSNGFFEEGNAAVLKTLMNESSAEKTFTNLLYNTINVNLYSQLLKSGVNYLANPRGGKAQMWVTKDVEGTVRFNDAVATEFEMAENGVFYVVDKLLAPPGLLEFLGVTATYSGLNVTNAYDLLIAASWDTADLGRSFGYKQGKQFTLFAPTDEFFTNLPLEETERLLDPAWSQHLDDLLKHWITDKSYTRKQLRQMTVSAGGEFELPMLSGSTIRLVAGGDDELSVSDGISTGKFFKPSNLRGVDGLIQVVSSALLPPSFQCSVLERASSDPELTILASFIRTAAVEDLVGDVQPFTLFAPEDDALINSSTLPNSTTTFLQSHLFEGMLFADTLLGMDGETITSVNEEQFLVTVEDDVVTLSSFGDPSVEIKVSVVATDILGNNGVMHRISGPLTDTSSVPITSAPTPTSTRLYLTGEVILEDATAAPTDSQTQIGTMAASDTISSVETFAPSEELETSMQSTDSPTNQDVDHVDEVTASPSNETILIESDETEGPSTLSETTLTATAVPSVETPSPSASPTQFVVVVGKEPDSDKEKEASDSAAESQVASATSSAYPSQHPNKVFSVALSLLQLLVL